MKLFSRKALVAGAAAVALSFAGTSVAAADEQPNFSSFSSSSEKPNDEDGETKPPKPEQNGSSDMKPQDISAWISVFTAVIGAFGALFAFASKHLGFKLL